MMNNDLRGLRRFCVWLVLCTLPFYFLDLIVGSLSELTRASLPAAALMAVVPAVAALAATARSGEWGELRIGLRLPRGPVLSWLVAVAAMPSIVFAASGYRGFENPGWTILMLSVVFLAGAAAEELGWTGFVLPRLRRVVGELWAAVGIGAVWALWHIVPYAQTGYTAAEIVGHCLFSIAFRVVLVRIATAANDSVWPPVVGHAVYNIAWSISPNAGLDYDPWAAAALTATLAACLYLVENVNSKPSRVP
jgi:uncharacterized protein